ncbi:MAG: hypothetical protein WD989_00995 [Candidatus Paceibacterota bacterium]
MEEPAFSNSAGTLVFNGGLPTPGFNGTNGKILSAVFRVKRVGSATVAFTSPAVRANDGYGTDVFRTGSQALYNLIAVTEEPLPTPVVTPTPVLAPTTLNISSTTHPDPSRWYSNNNPLFKWDVPSGVTEVLLTLNRSSGAVPSIRYTPPISERILTNLDEGTWYFNARFRTTAGLGPIASFRINIDTTPPRPFNITRLDPNDTKNPRPELLFESSDATSGIDRYEMKVGDKEWVKIAADLGGRSYAMPVQKYGEYSVEIKALDRAGNSTSAKIDIKIDPIKAPIIKELTSETKKGEALIVKGIAEPGTKVVLQAIKKNYDFIELVPEANAIYAVKIDDNHFTTTTTTTTTGDWYAEMEGLPAGRYKVVAIAQDERLAVSELSNSAEFIVRGGFLDYIIRIFDKTIDLLSNGWMFIAFLIALVGLMLALIELIRIKAKTWINRDGFKPFIDLFVIKRTLKKSNYQVDHIIKDMEKELTFLRTLSKRRKLGPEENYLKEKMEQYLKTLKELKKLDK